MIDFLKSFLSGDKTSDEKALMASMQKKDRDILLINGAVQEEEEKAGCGSGGCGGCNCR
jgi:hypothetical protein